MASSSTAPAPYSADRKISSPATSGVAALTEALIFGRNGEAYRSLPSGVTASKPCRVKKMANSSPPTLAATGDE